MTRLAARRLFRNTEELEKLSELGVLFLLFEMGLELSLDRLKVLLAPPPRYFSQSARRSVSLMLKDTFCAGPCQVCFWPRDADNGGLNGHLHSLCASPGAWHWHANLGEGMVTIHPTTPFQTCRGDMHRYTVPNLHVSHDLARPGVARGVRAQCTGCPLSQCTGRGVRGLVRPVCQVFHASPKLAAVGSVDEAVVIGAALSLSSSAFVLQLLSERGELATKFGSATLGILLLQARPAPALHCTDSTVFSGNLSMTTLGSHVQLRFRLYATWVSQIPWLFAKKHRTNPDVITAWKHPSTCGLRRQAMAAQALSPFSHTAFDHASMVLIRQGLSVQDITVVPFLVLLPLVENVDMVILIRQGCARAGHRGGALPGAAAAGGERGHGGAGRAGHVHHHAADQPGPDPAPDRGRPRRAPRRRPRCAAPHLRDGALRIGFSGFQGPGALLVGGRVVLRRIFEMVRAQSCSACGGLLSGGSGPGSVQPGMRVVALGNGMAASGLRQHDLVTPPWPRVSIRD